MYLEFFGFREKPFSITPDPRFIFLSKNHKEVFAHLLYGIRHRAGFVAVTGEIGAGKTTVLRTLFDQLEGDEYRLAFIFNPSLTAEELLRAVARELTLDLAESEGGTLLDRLNTYLLRENRSGRTVVLVIDEAQNLTPAVLEQIRLLSNLETRHEKLIQIVLVGQPELEDLLDRPDLRQLKQRITVRYHLRSMDFEDTRDYIRHRLDLAGVADRALFTPPAIRAVYRHSGGLPRLINLLCDRALLVAFSEDRAVVDMASLRQALRELRTRPGKRERPAGVLTGRQSAGWPLWTATLAALLVVAVLVYQAPVGDGPSSAAGEADRWREANAKEPPATTEPAPERRPPQVGDLREALAELSGQRSAALGFSAVVRRWGQPQLSAPGLAAEDLPAAAAARGLQASPFSGALQTLLNLDTPVLLELALPGATGKRYLAVTAAAEGRYAIAPRLNGRERLLWDELAALWTGQGWFFWINYDNLPYLNRPGARGPEVKRLQRTMAAAGLYPEKVTGRYDPATIEAVTRLQDRRQVLRDGLVGPQTLLLIYQETPGRAVPRLGKEEGGAP